MFVQLVNIAMKITPDDLTDVNASNEDFHSNSMMLEEVLSLHYQSWRSVNVTEVFSTSDVKIQMKMEAILSKKNITFHSDFPYYSVPNKLSLDEKVSLNQDNN